MFRNLKTVCPVIKRIEKKILGNFVKCGTLVFVIPLG